MLMTKRKSQRGHVRKVPASGDEPATPATSDKSAQVAEYIGRELRSMFDGVVAEPVPERFRQLLAELEQKRTKD
jgi:hypothetical protein